MKTMGILLDNRVFRGVPRGRTGHERIDLYRKAGSKHGLRPLFMSLNRIDFRRRRANGYMWSGGSYRLVNRSVPAAIHNRAMPFDRASRSKLRRLSRISHVFNGQTRYSKYKIHRLLSRDSFARDHLPPTKPFGRSELQMMTSAYDRLFIKPQSGSVGKGIIRIRRMPGGVWSVRTGKGATRIRTATLYRKLRSWTRGKKYLIQQEIDLARYRNRPYDIRVSIQRANAGMWRMTGMVGKVAKRGRHVTNVSRGGTVRRVEPLFQASGLPAEQVKERVRYLSLHIARCLSRRLKRLADIGLDIGVDRYGKPYLIELNGRDQRYSFRKAGMNEQFNATYENPVRYAAYLIARKANRPE